VSTITKPLRPQDVFGENATFEEAQRVYRELVRESHPDRLPKEATPEQVAAATEQFIQLSAMWRIARELFDNGTWDDPGLAGLTVTSKKKKYLIGGRLERGDIADIYSCGAGVIKIARSPRDGDLMRREVTSIKKIRREAHESKHVFLPRLTDALRVKDSSRVERQANVFDALPANRPGDSGQWVTLADVAKAYPNGIDAKDMAWMWRRILTALSLAHDAGIVHHAPFPDNIMILPPEHGVVLIDWCYSAEAGTKPVAIIPRYRDWYPDEVLEKQPSTPATDIFIAAKSMVRVLGGDPVLGKLRDPIPRAIRAHFRACVIPQASMRPSDTISALRSFDDLIERLWGRRKFREFKMPGDR
jgi:serine/threonine protein kinase